MRAFDHTSVCPEIAQHLPKHLFSLTYSQKGVIDKLMAVVDDRIFLNIERLVRVVDVGKFITGGTTIRRFFRLTAIILLN